MKISGKEGWLINPWLDTLLLTGFPGLFILPLLWGLMQANAIPAGLLTFAVSTMPYLVGMHCSAIYTLVYLDANELRSKPFLYGGVPVFLAGLFYVLIVHGYKTQISSLLFYMIIVHEIFQYCVILQVFYLTRAWSSLSDILIANAALIFAPFYFFLNSLSSLKYEYFGPVWNLPVNHHFLFGLKLLAILMMVVFFIRQIYLYMKQRKVFWFSILMVVSSGAIFCLPLLVFKHRELFFYWTFKIHHDVQYLLWAFCYACFKFKGRVAEGAKVLSFLSSPRRIIYFFAFLLAMYMLIGVGMRILKMMTHQPALYDHLFMIMLGLHIYLDFVFWWNTPKISNIVV